MIDTFINSNDDGSVEIGVVNQEFPNTEKLMVTTSIDLADIISQFFGQVLKDYYGCKIARSGTASTLPEVASLYPQGSLYVDLYFKYNTKDVNDSEKVTALIPRVQTNETKNERKQKTIGERLAAINAISRTSSLYGVSDDLKKVLAPYTIRGKATNWTAITKEITAPMSTYGKDDTIVCISGIDLGAIIAAIYGMTEVDEDTKKENKIEYHISVGKNIPMKTDEFIVEIKRYNTKNFYELQRKLGVAVSSNTSFHVWGNR